MELTESQKDLLIRIGVTLMLVQTVERILRLTMTFVFQKTSPLTLEAIETQQEAERRKTLGYFIAELKKRVDVHPSLEQGLSQFLTMRNAFVHNLSDVPGWDSDSDEGCAHSMKFVNQLFSLSQTVLKVFTGVIRSWQEQVKSDLPVPENAFFKEVDAKYTPLVHAMFAPKIER
jgi:hypothetical protein